MIKAYLTIDDVTTSLTPGIVDFLTSKSITPIMFCWGERLLAHPDEAIYALKHGVILQNHSFSHPEFSKLSLWKAKREIMKNEKIIESLYKKAGVDRPFKLFRFPYGNNGGEKAEDLQEFLERKGFAHIDDRAFADDAYFRPDHKQKRDVLWTFDFAEYNLREGNPFTFDDVKKNVKNFIELHEDDPDDGKAHHIILIHDHEETEERHPGYFQEQITMLLDAGVKFAIPKIQ
ncbi:MAG: polysaccharide deacetylase family protein [Treponema sp.]|nr:polysaccharide deacetylase family protein [Candidatus Treponema caballi]